ncbi:MAG: glycoside hydrolase family 38 C-terminal domain-containing protein [Dysgonomonas sp.]|nr:glycoside hydrolase family 38 C-terminal domain-containing protein [Dysgonomonas sp.]
MRKAAITSILIILFTVNNALSQEQAYFVDGYHGGVYGHYPMWVTQFMVDKLKGHPEWRIGLEIEPETWDTVSIRDWHAYKNFKNIVTDKRIEFTNPTYAQPYCYNISGESIIRQFEYGMRKIYQHFPDVKFTTYSVEEPCFTSCLPQILKSFGFRYAVLKCPDTCWGGYTAAYGGELVNWIGPDGTSILTVPRYACEEFEDNSTWQTKAWSNSDSYLKACFDYGIRNPVGMCYQDAGWDKGPWLGYGSNIKNKSIYVTWKEYIEEISSGKTNDDYHFSQEDVLVNLVWGSQVLQQIAQQVRISENKIVMAEKIAAMANIDNSYLPSQKKIDDAWRTLMMAQHHDSWIVPYNRLNKKNTWAEEISLWTNNTNNISNNIINNAINSYIPNNRLSSDNLGYIKVYNTLGIKRTEVVNLAIPSKLANKDIDIYNSKNKLVTSHIEKTGDSIRVSFYSDIPAFGYATYSIRERNSKIKTTQFTKFGSNGDCVFENDIYKIVIDPTRGGIIKSLIAKKEKNKEYVDKDNEFGLGELRGHFYEENKFYSSTDSPAKITVLEDNNLKTTIRIEGQIASHPFIQIITLIAGQKRIDFDLTINWKDNVGIGEYKQDGGWQKNRRAFTDDRFKLNVMFPVNLNSTQLYKNAPFDVCESKLDNTFFKTWDSIKHNVILNWVDLVEKDQKHGFALLSDHTTSYSYGEDFPLSLTAQYSGVAMWGVNYKISKPLKMKYAVIPHSGKWDKATIATESNKWNEPLIVSYLENAVLTDKSLLDLNNSGYEVTAFKAQSSSDILIRLFNAEGNDSTQKIIFGFPISGIEEVNLDGETISKKSLENNQLSLSMPRFGIKTFKIMKNE